MTISRHLSLFAAIFIFSFQAFTPAAAQGMSDEERMARVKRLMAEPNPLEPSDSVWIEDLTYMEVRDRIAAGATTAIVSTGGIEENGPFLATGKHNVILEALCPAIAEELGNALCAPIVPFVPEGNIDPPSGAMHFPGSFSVRDETYQALLEGHRQQPSSARIHGHRLYRRQRWQSARDESDGRCIERAMDGRHARPFRCRVLHLGLVGDGTLYRRSARRVGNAA